MNNIERIPFAGLLPESFFTITTSIYTSLPFTKQEDHDLVLRLFIDELERNDIIIYTDHKSIRLVGIYPKTGVDAYFGFWETGNDIALNIAAFEYLQQDSLGKGKHKLTGPINFTTYQPYRLRLSLPSWIKFDNEPVNPLYYEQLLTKVGFDKEILFESRMIKQADIPGVFQVKENLLKAIEVIPYERIPITVETWSQYEDEIFELVQVIFSANPLYKSISKNQFLLLYNKSFAEKLCPHSSVFFKENATGRLSSLSFCQPNYEDLRLPLGYRYTYKNDFKRLNHKVLLVKSVGVHPEFRKQGLMNFMAAHAMLSFQGIYEEVIFCMTREDNVSNNFTQYLPYEKADYALFTKLLQT